MMFKETIKRLTAEELDFGVVTLLNEYEVVIVYNTITDEDLALHLKKAIRYDFERNCFERGIQVDEIKYGTGNSRIRFYNGLDYENELVPIDTIQSYITDSNMLILSSNNFVEEYKKLMYINIGFGENPV